MRRIVVLVAALILWHTPSFAQFVERVVDGDTIVVQGVGKVRLIGVDTPETVDPRKPVQFFGKEASEFTRRTVRGKVVRLDYDWERKDKYDRTLAYVYLQDGTFVNAEIIRQGYGHAYTSYPFKYLDQFTHYEREAREAGRGLWGSNRDAAKGTSPPSASEQGNPADTVYVEPAIAPRAVAPERAVPAASSGQCRAITKKGTQCSRKAQGGSAYCWQHAR